MLTKSLQLFKVKNFLKKYITIIIILLSNEQHYFSPDKNYAHHFSKLNWPDHNQTLLAYFLSGEFWENFNYNINQDIFPAAANNTIFPHFDFVFFNFFYFIACTSFPWMFFMWRQENIDLSE